MHGYRKRMHILPIAFVAALSSASLSIGCVGFRGPNLASSPWPPAESGVKKAVAVEILGPRGDFGTQFQKQALKAYEDSNLFSEVRTGSASADIHAEIRVTVRGHANLLMARLTGVTLYLIPSSASDEYTATTRFKDASGNLIATTTKTQTVTLWQQLFLIFLMPTNGLGGETRQLY